MLDEVLMAKSHNGRGNNTELQFEDFVLKGQYE